MKRIRLMVRIIILGVFFVMGGLVGCNGGVANSTPSLTETPAASLIFTSTAMLTSTTTATSTPRPTYTPTFLPAPYLTPATPETDGQVYKLVEWTPQRVEELAALLEKYTHNVPPSIRFVRTANERRRIAEILAEAILRFPDASQVDRWRWEMGVYLAGGDYGSFDFETEGMEYFSGLILEVLNSGEKSLEEIPEWAANSIEGRIVSIDNIDYAPMGFHESYLVNVNDEAFMWLLRSSSGDFVIQPLMSSYGMVWYFPGVAIMEDMTGDGIPEIIVEIGRDASGGENSYNIRVYDITQYPAVPIHIYDSEEGFKTEIWYYGGVGDWILMEEGQGNRYIRVRTTLAFCDIRTVKLFQWNGEWIEQIDIWKENPPRSRDELTYCVENNLWRPERNLDIVDINIIETILPFYPPPLTPSIQAFFTYSADALDELRFHLGILHALKGNTVEAREYMLKIVAELVVPESSWILPAEEFLEAFQTQTDIYVACSQVPSCDLNTAMEYLVENLDEGSYSDALDALTNYGVPIISSGYFDFDEDEQAELWVVVRPRESAQLEFWILASTTSGFKALFVNDVSSGKPNITIFDNINGRNLVRLEGETFFTFHRLRANNKPYVIPIDIVNDNGAADPPEPPDALSVAIDELLAGADPKVIVATIRALQDDPNYEVPIQYYYYLGLANELAGDEKAAIEAYLMQWETFPYELWDVYEGEEIIYSIPYTLMARMKLELVP